MRYVSADNVINIIDTSWVVNLCVGLGIAIYLSLSKAVYLSLSEEKMFLCEILLHKL